MRCPRCGSQLDENNYCYDCMEFFDDSEELENDFNDSDSYFEDVDYESMVNNGDSICLNCTYWSVSPYGAAHGMVCRKGYFSDGPDDSCGDFVQQHNFASYGNNGEFQFDETDRAISNKLRYWKNSR